MKFLRLLLGVAALAFSAGAFADRLDYSGFLPVNGNSSNTTTTATGGSASRTLADHAADNASIVDTGASTGASNNTSEINAAFAAWGVSLVPKGTWPTTTSITSLNFRAISLQNGQITDSAGNKRAPWMTRIQTAPSSVGDWTGFTTFANGDLSRTLLFGETDIEGSTTLDNPAWASHTSGTGYYTVREAFPVGLAGRNASGNNISTSIADGRTQAGLLYLKTFQVGQGDYFSILCEGVVSSTRSGSTSFLANPAMGCLNGGLYGAVNGSYIEFLGDMNIIDTGFDIAGYHVVTNSNRTNATGAKNVNWINIDLQSGVGTKPIDSFLRTSLKTTVGWDASNINYPDKILATISRATAGSGYSAGNVFKIAGGTCDQTTYITLLATGDGTVGPTQGTDWSIERHGMCSVAPSTPNTPTCQVSITDTTACSGTGAQFNVIYDSGVLIASPANSYWFGNVTQDAGVYSTKFTSTLLTGTPKFGYNGSAWSVTGGLTIDSSTNNLSVFSSTTSAQLFGVISDETGGSGVLVGSASPTFTGIPVSPSLNISGAVSKANIGATGAGLYTTAATYTDTASSGTVANFAAHAFAAPTLAASSATTCTVCSTVLIAGPPTAGSGVTATVLTAFRIASGGMQVAGTSNFQGAVTINVSNNAVTNIGTGTTSSQVTLGGGSNNIAVGSPLMIGSATPLTLAVGEIGFTKIAASGSAPGAAGAKEAWVCGTLAGTAKKIAYAGTSTTPVTIVDNVGTGVTGC